MKIIHFKVSWMWSVFHSVVAVHTWRAWINTSIDTRCNCCDLGTEESPYHRFYACPRAMEVWDYSQSIIYHIKDVQLINGPHVQLSFLQCVSGLSIPCRFQEIKSLWTLLHGSSLWVIWIAKNSVVFSQDWWPLELIQKVIWEAFLDAGRKAQLKAQLGAHQRLQAFDTIWAKIDGLWLKSLILAHRQGASIVWNKRAPPSCSFH